MSPELLPATATGVISDVESTPQPPSVRGSGSSVSSNWSLKQDPKNSSDAGQKQEPDLKTITKHRHSRKPVNKSVGVTEHDTLVKDLGLHSPKKKSHHDPIANGTTGIDEKSDASNSIDNFSLNKKTGHSSAVSGSFKPENLTFLPEASTDSYDTDTRLPGEYSVFSNDAFEKPLTPTGFVDLYLDSYEDLSSATTNVSKSFKPVETSQLATSSLQSDTPDIPDEDFPAPVSSPELYRELAPSHPLSDQDFHYNATEIEHSMEEFGATPSANYSQQIDKSDSSDSSASSPQFEPSTSAGLAEYTDLTDQHIVTTVLEHYGDYTSPLLPLPHAFPRPGRHNTTNSITSYAGSDSTASLSTGRRSPQSFAASNRESIDMRAFRYSHDSTISTTPSAEESLEKRRSESKLKWKYLGDIEEPSEPKSSVHSAFKSEEEVTPTAMQDSSISNEISMTHTDFPLSVERQKAPTSPGSPDPELAELYQDSATFLNRPVSVLPHHPSHSKSFTNEISGLRELAEVTEEEATSTKDTVGNGTLHDISSELASTLTLNTEAEPLKLDLSLKTPTMTSVGSKLNRPPVFDFRELLSHPNSEDRRNAFHRARVNEFEYNSGINTWLERSYEHVFSEAAASGNSQEPKIFADGVVRNTSANGPVGQPGPMRTKSVTMATFANNANALKAGLAQKLSINMPKKVGGLSSKVSIKKGIFGRSRKDNLST